MICWMGDVSAVVRARQRMKEAMWLQADAMAIRRWHALKTRGKCSPHARCRGWDAHRRASSSSLGASRPPLQACSGEPHTLAQLSLAPEAIATGFPAAFGPGRSSKVIVHPHVLQGHHALSPEATAACINAPAHDLSGRHHQAHGEGRADCGVDLPEPKSLSLSRPGCTTRRRGLDHTVLVCRK